MSVQDNTGTCQHVCTIGLWDSSAPRSSTLLVARVSSCKPDFYKGLNKQCFYLKAGSPTFGDVEEDNIFKDLAGKGVFYRAGH